MGVLWTARAGPCGHRCAISGRKDKRARSISIFHLLLIHLVLLGHPRSWQMEERDLGPSPTPTVDVTKRRNVGAVGKKTALRNLHRCRPSRSLPLYHRHVTAIVN